LFAFIYNAERLFADYGVDERTCSTTCPSEARQTFWPNAMHTVYMSAVGRDTH